MEPTKQRSALSKLLALLAVSLLALVLTQVAVAAGPGEGEPVGEHNSLVQLKSIVGQVVLSEDACGTNSPACTVDILKPSLAATVREADLFCATTGFSGHMPVDSEVTLNATPVAWAEIVPSAISSFNARSDVTAIVKPVGDAALVGPVTYTITENPTFNYDGCILKVIWNDPTTTTNSILVFWGAQSTAGDTFTINFAQPLSAAAFVNPLEFSLGISFGFQPSDQFSQVDVNGMRMTTSAGGQDDGEPANGALITVGGTGDTPVNPPPNDPPTTDRIPDDERYDVRPFTSIGATSMTIFTLNPSNDDNIFVANVFLPNVTVVGPGPVCPPEEDDDDGDGLDNGDENRLLTLLNVSDSDLDGTVDGNDDANGNGLDDEDEDDDDDDEDDECPDDDDGDGEDDEDEDDDEDDD